LPLQQRKQVLVPIYCPFLLEIWMFMICDYKLIVIMLPWLIYVVMFNLPGQHNYWQYGFYYLEEATSTQQPIVGSSSETTNHPNS
jgi:hypothetical protein